MQIVIDTLRPLLLISMSLFFLPVTAFELLRSFDLSPFFSPSSFRKRWFSRFWRFFGPLSRQAGTDSVAPLLNQARGRVLDLGTGAGHWLDFYDKSKVTKIYAVEPNVGHHRGLKQKAREAGLEGVIEVTGEMVEKLESQGVRKGSIDTVVTVQVLCSIDTQRELTKELYQYLAPGGQWLVYEHVRAHGNPFVVRWQAALNWVWPICFGGCSLQSDTVDVIRASGKWKSDTIKQAPGDSPTSAIPSIVGVLVK
ncbi:MAG: hypothetical protein MMC23_005935 [Stictis urceolatum]|nr:hypothetical protein [Stictis urceolata]